DESVNFSESGPLRGKEEFKQRSHTVFLGAFPDLRMTVEGVLAEGDAVVVRWSATGTHSGDCLGCPATGRHVAFRGMTWIRYRDGKMIEGWDCWNQAALIQSVRDAEAGGETDPAPAGAPAAPDPAPASAPTAPDPSPASEATVPDA